MRILALPRFGLKGASSRLRFFQFLPALQRAGIDSVVAPLIEDDLLARKYLNGRYSASALLVAYARRVHDLLSRRRFDLVWIEKEALPWIPASFERRLLAGVPYALDFDDAVFHNYDRNGRPWVRKLLGRRIDDLMARASLVIAGNGYLADRAMQAGAARTEILPTVVDLDRYAVATSESPTRERMKVVWIGSPSTAQYLSMLAESLAVLAQKHPFTLRVVGGAVSLPGVDVEVVPWTEHTEVTAINECDVGVMPLFDTPWEQGKCAYKLIQYMACGLPTIASPVGANCDVTVEGETGYLAGSTEQWVASLEALFCDAALRRRLGEAGRARVEQRYSLQRVAPRLSELLREAGETSRCVA
jgi:glycosyltransferase involved in cell wall biosynthesis